MSDTQVKVAVIGAGSAGTFAAFDLYKRFGDKVALTIYERNHRAGGRAWDVDFAGATIEVGGTLLHSSGRHTMELMEFTGAKEGVPGVSVDGDAETYAFWTKKGFPVFTKTSLFAMATGILKHVGPLSALRVTNAATGMSSNWESIYDLQDQGKSYATTDDMLRDMGLLEVTRTPLHEFLRKKHVNKRMAVDIVEPIIHNMYNQGLELNAFAGLVGLAGAGLAGGYLFAIEGGNWSLFQRAVEKITTDVRFDTSVASIDVVTSDEAPSSFSVTTASGSTDTYDLVVLAAPPALSGIEVRQNAKKVRITVNPYQEVRTTLVVGDLNPHYFHANPNKELPSTIFTADSTGAPFQSIGVTGYSPQYQSRIYKIFSADHYMTSEELSHIFSDVHDVYDFSWPGAYPVLSPDIEHVPFEILPGLYFANAFETAAGSIEVEAVSGVNAARVAAHYLEKLI